MDCLITHLLDKTHDCPPIACISLDVSAGLPLIEASFDSPPGVAYRSIAHSGDVLRAVAIESPYVCVSQKAASQKKGKIECNLRESVGPSPLDQGLHDGHIYRLRIAATCSLLLNLHNYSFNTNQI